MKEWNFEIDFNKQIFRALTISWMALIFLLSSQPTLPLPSLFWGQDKLMHVLMFGVLGLFAARSLKQPETWTFQRILLITAFVAAYGATDEYHQMFVPGRDASGWDLLADGAGGFLASLFVRWRDNITLNLNGADIKKWNT